MKHEKHFEKIEIKKLPKSEVEISGEITLHAMDEARKIALDQLKKSVEVPGFRAGNTPDKVLEKHVGEVKILEEAARYALDAEYGNIIHENNIRAIGMPKITITKLAPGNPLGFKAVTAVLPEVKLENYSKIAKEEGAKHEDKEITVEDKDVELVINDIRKRAAQANRNLDADASGLPALTDGFVKTLGDFKDVADFKEKIKVETLTQKKNQARDKKRIAVVEKLIKEAAIDIPELLISGELDTMIGQLKHDIEQAGLTYETYLTQIQKKEEEIRSEWRDHAKNKASLQLILNHIAKKENIKPDEERVKKEIEIIVGNHKNADRFRVRMYVENILTNDAVFEFLGA